MVFNSPNFSTLVCTIFSTSSYLLTSATATQLFRPSFSISLATSSQPDWLAGMSLMQTS